MCTRPVGYGTLQRRNEDVILITLIELTERSYSIFTSDMDVDTSLNTVGLYGRLQCTNFILFALGVSLAAIQLTSVSFTIDQSVEHYCNPHPGFLANETTPFISKDDGTLEPDGCHMYGVLNGTLIENTTDCLDGWKYPAFENGEKSIVTDVSQSSYI